MGGLFEKKSNMSTALISQIVCVNVQGILSKLLTYLYLTHNAGNTFFFSLSSMIFQVDLKVTLSFQWSPADIGLLT